MKRFLSLFFALSFALFGLAGSAMALTIVDLPVNYSGVLSPESLPGGENLTIERNDHDPAKSLLSIIDKRNDSRIEIYARIMQKEAHATKLFDVFYEQLGKKNITIEDKKNGYSYVTGIEGKKVKYTLEAHNMTIVIQTYAFSISKDSQNAAIIVVGYYPLSTQGDGEALFDAVVHSLLVKD